MQKKPCNLPSLLHSLYIISPRITSCSESSYINIKKLSGNLISHFPASFAFFAADLSSSS